MPPPRRALASADHAIGRMNVGPAGETATTLRRVKRNGRNTQRRP